MERLLEIILGFLFGVHVGPAGPGVERSVSFNPPQWMSWWHLSPRIVNFFLVVVAVAVVVAVYRRDGRHTGPRVGLGIPRLVLAYVLILINRPVIVTTETFTEPSVLAVLVDTTASMAVPDVNPDFTPTFPPPARPPPWPLSKAAAIRLYRSPPAAKKLATTRMSTSARNAIGSRSDRFGVGQPALNLRAESSACSTCARHNACATGS